MSDFYMTIPSKRTGSNPFKYIAEDFQIPYEVAVCYAEYERALRKSTISFQNFTKMHQDYMLGDTSTMLKIAGYWGLWAYEQVNQRLPLLAEREKFEQAIKSALA